MKAIIIYFTLAAVLVSVPAIANSSNVADVIRANLEELSDESKEIKNTAKVTDEDILSGDPRQILDMLSEHEKHKQGHIRSHAYRWGVRVAKLHPSPEIRREVTSRLVDATLYPELGFGGNTCTLLMDFQAKDFDDKIKAKILAELNKNAPGKGLILICGVADIQEAMPALEKIIEDAKKNNEVSKTWYYTKRWHARLALARMGTDRHIQRSVSLIEGQIDTHNNFNMFTDLAYIRQPEAVESLKKYFLSDLRLPSSEAGYDGELYAKYLMPKLDDILANFPVKQSENVRSGRNYTMEEIELCREWMSKQTEWQIVR